MIGSSNCPITGVRLLLCTLISTKYNSLWTNRIYNENLDRDWFSAPICHVIAAGRIGRSLGCPIDLFTVNPARLHYNKI